MTYKLQLTSSLLLLTQKVLCLFAHPLDDVAQPFFERDGGLPAEKLLGFAGVEIGRHHFTDGAGAIFTLELIVGELCQGAMNGVDVGGDACADVDVPVALLSSASTLRQQHRHHSRNRFVYFLEILVGRPANIAPANMAITPASPLLSWRAIDIGVTQGDILQTIGVHIEVEMELHAQLVSAIVILWLRPGGFLKGELVCSKACHRSHHLCWQRQSSFTPCLRAISRIVERAQNIDISIVQLINHAAAHICQRRLVTDGVDLPIGDDLGHLLIADVGFVELYPFGWIVFVASVQIIDCHNIMTCCLKGFDNVAADKTRATGYEYVS